MLFRSSYSGVDAITDADNPLVYSSSQSVNLIPLLAYQKIYYDFFSNSQWEKHLAYAYNVDYWPGNTSIVPTKDMLKLRYANYPKDYFMGVLPNSQYGSVAVLPSSFTSAYASNRIVSDNRTNSYLFQQVGSGAVSMTESVPSNTPVTLNTDLSALSIRATLS